MAGYPLMLRGWLRHLLIILARGRLACGSLCFFLCLPVACLRSKVRFRAMRLVSLPGYTPCSDSMVGREIYAGHFAFADWVERTGGGSVFAAKDPPPAWWRELFGFTWIRHLQAARAGVYSACARALIDDFDKIGWRKYPVAYAPAVLSQRVMAWIAHVPFILYEADTRYRDRFFKRLDFHVYCLRYGWFFLPCTKDRLLCLIALGHAAGALSNWHPLWPKVMRWLDREFARQILPDGSHISRNPDAIIEILSAFLPLRRICLARGLPQGFSLISAADRMASMLRFFCHGDGSVASFNGSRGTRSADIVTVLAWDDTDAAPLSSAIHSGYERIQQGESLVLIDSGTFAGRRGIEAPHAGCGSFEFSRGECRIVVNCGLAYACSPLWERAVRSTAAHSAVTISDAPSCVFPGKGLIGRMMGDRCLSYPDVVTVQRRDPPGQAVVEVSHDGYEERFGVCCRRRFLLRKGGDELFGEDAFLMEEASDVLLPYMIRFHIHPDVAVERVPDKSMVMLTLADGDLWGFVVRSGMLSLQDSIYLPYPGGAQQTHQIVVSGKIREQSRVVWLFRRLDDRGKRAALG